VHDLRNQLTIIIASAQHLAPRVQKPDPDIADLLQSADRATVLAREILLAARPRLAARRPVDLTRVVRAAEDTLSRVIGSGIRVDLCLAAGPIQVNAEVLELERIILNLALNARDAMGTEGVLTISTAVLDMSSKPVHGVLPGQYVRLTVADSGPGLTPEVRARMFEPFFTTKEAGTGLGLSSVAYTARQLQGTVVVESEPGRGTSVSVILPLSGDPRTSL
jgi:two-component system, cell cycle sensor histidine kinase and response regulator CckA